ncbi:MAG: hypothetical protein IJ359_01250 [Erysipelotrichaceae bacterium]|nr:hypothetical protein [Erysipelotrichaceae bacterium]
MINILLKNDDEYILDTIGLPPINYDGPEYNIRALDKYCKEKGMKPEELSDNELKQFELEKK